MGQDFIPQLFQGKKYEIEITDRAATIRMRDGGKLVIPDSVWIFINDVEIRAGFINAAVKVVDKDTGEQRKICCLPPEKIIGSLRSYRLESTDETSADEANQ